MESSRAWDWVKQNRWWVALALVIIAGYLIGKDRALRDNRAAEARVGEASQ